MAFLVQEASNARKRKQAGHVKRFKSISVKLLADMPVRWMLVFMRENICTGLQ